MAKNVSLKCVGVCKNVAIMVCGVKVAMNLYVLLAKGEGYCKSLPEGTRDSLVKLTVRVASFWQKKARTPSLK